jgi:hypothetical protein
METRRPATVRVVSFSPGRSTPAVASPLLKVTHTARHPLMEPTNEMILAALFRLEQKLDLLLQALAEDEGEPPLTLDGTYAGSEREEGTPL